LWHGPAHHRPMIKMPTSLVPSIGGHGSDRDGYRAFQVLVLHIVGLGFCRGGGPILCVWHFCNFFIWLGWHVGHTAFYFFIFTSWSKKNEVILYILIPESIKLIVNYFISTLVYTFLFWVKYSISPYGLKIDQISHFVSWLNGLTCELIRSWNVAI
jgi:hypothetical protein